MKKKKRIATKLLNSLEEAILMDNNQLNGRETFRKLLLRDQFLGSLKRVLRNILKKIK